MSRNREALGDAVAFGMLVVLIVALLLFVVSKGAEGSEHALNPPGPGFPQVTPPVVVTHDPDTYWSIQTDRDGRLVVELYKPGEDEYERQRMRTFRLLDSYQIVVDEAR